MSSISPASQAEATNALKALFTAFPVERGHGVGGAATYLIAVEGYSEAAIRKAVTRLIRGEFDWFDGRFLPTPAQVSRAARYCEDLIAPPKTLALPAPGDEVLTDEEAERRLEMAARLKAQWGSKPEPVEPGEDFDTWDRRVKDSLASNPPRLSAEALSIFDEHNQEPPQKEGLAA